MSGEETTLTSSGIVKRAVSSEDFLRWFAAGGEVERKEIQEEVGEGVTK